MIDIENALELQRILITSNLSDEKLRRINELIDLIREDARQEERDRIWAEMSALNDDGK